MVDFDGLLVPEFLENDLGPEGLERSVVIVATSDQPALVRLRAGFVAEPILAALREPFLLESSLPGVFAVGDVRSGSVKRVASAVGEGSMAVRFVHQYLAESSTPQHD